MSRVKILANKYSDYYWRNLTNCFSESSLKIEGMPQDIINVLVGIIGEETIEWIDRPLHMLDDETARNLVKTEEGCKALKELIMRMPN